MPESNEIASFVRRSDHVTPEPSVLTITIPGFGLSFLKSRAANEQLTIENAILFFGKD